MKKVKELAELPHFPTTHMPPFDRLAWRLQVDGLVAKPLSLSYDQLLALPRVEQTSPFECVDGWRVSQNRWEGVLVKDLLDMAGAQPEARYVVFHAGEFTVSLPLAEAREPKVLLAHGLNEAPLPPEHGAPLRLVAPGKQCYFGVKWIQRLELARFPRQRGRRIALDRLRPRANPPN